MQQPQWITTLFRAWIFLSFRFLQENETPYKEHLTKDTGKLAKMTCKLRDLCKGNWQIVQYFFHLATRTLNVPLEYCAAVKEVKKEGNYSISNCKKSRLKRLTRSL